jgi:hypothetical protein
MLWVLCTMIVGAGRLEFSYLNRNKKSRKKLLFLWILAKILGFFALVGRLTGIPAVRNWAMRKSMTEPKKSLVDTVTSSVTRAEALLGCIVSLILITGWCINTILPLHDTIKSQETEIKALKDNQVLQAADLKELKGMFTTYMLNEANTRGEIKQTLSAVQGDIKSLKTGQEFIGDYFHRKQRSTGDSNE